VAGGRKAQTPCVCVSTGAGRIPVLGFGQDGRKMMTFPFLGAFETYRHGFGVSRTVLDVRANVNLSSSSCT
jgi:hypothetical protein